MKQKISVEVTQINKSYSFSSKYIFFSALFEKVFNCFGLKFKKKNDDSVHVLKDITFKISNGISLGIIGTNGSGKSTLLQIITAILRPSSGRILTSGRIASVLELGSGFNPDFTGKENIYINSACLGLSTVQVSKVYNKIVEFADIGKYIDKPIKTYSTGMVARLAFSIIANVDADILVIDEALSVGDSRFSLKCIRFIKNFKKRGIVIFVSHDMETVSAICDKCIWLHAGSLMSLGDPKSVIQDYNSYLFGNGNSSSVDDVFNNNSISPVQVSSNINTGVLELIDFSFIDEYNHNDIIMIEGASNCILKLKLKSFQNLTNLVVGFIVLNKNGLEVAVCNTRDLDPGSVLSVDSGGTLEIAFKFQLPNLRQGDYSISIGAIDTHDSRQITHLFLQDYFLFKSVSSFDNGIIQFGNASYVSSRI